MAFHELVRFFSQEFSYSNEIFIIIDSAFKRAGSQHIVKMNNSKFHVLFTLSFERSIVYQSDHFLD